LLLLLSLTGRMERVEEKLSWGNITDCEKEDWERVRDIVGERLVEAAGLKRLNDRRLLQVVDMLENHGLEEEKETLLVYVSTKEELLRVRSNCEQIERNILV